jgi:hypothetical protein
MSTLPITNNIVSVGVVPFAKDCTTCHAEVRSAGQYDLEWANVPWTPITVHVPEPPLTATPEPGYAGVILLAMFAFVLARGWKKFWEGHQL